MSFFLLNLIFFGEILPLFSFFARPQEGAILRVLAKKSEDEFCNREGKLWFCLENYASELWKKITRKRVISGFDL